MFLPVVIILLLLVVALLGFVVVKEYRMFWNEEQCFTAASREPAEGGAMPEPEEDEEDALSFGEELDIEAPEPDESLFTVSLKGAAEREKELFEKLHRTIIEQRLFLDPDFSRETYMRLGGLNRNKAAHMLKEYAGTNLYGYINSLRLDYAEKMLRTYPDAQIKAIAFNSGFNNVRTFYRLFEARYGVTPSIYRKQL